MTSQHSGRLTQWKPTSDSVSQGKSMISGVYDRRGTPVHIDKNKL